MHHSHYLVVGSKYIDLRIVLPVGLIDVLVVCAVCISTEDLRGLEPGTCCLDIGSAVTAIPVALHGTSEICMVYILVKGSYKRIIIVGQVCLNSHRGWQLGHA